MIFYGAAFIAIGLAAFGLSAADEVQRLTKLRLGRGLALNAGFRPSQ